MAFISAASSNLGKPNQAATSDEYFEEYMKSKSDGLKVNIY